MKVGVLGGGRWGQALARLVKAAGNEPIIAYKDKKPPHILKSTKDAPSVSAECELLLVATSASELRSAIRLAAPGPRNRVVVAGRGLEPETSRWLSDVVREESDVLRVGALAGPAPVQEILNGGLCAGVVASPFSDVQRLTTRALHSSRYRVYESRDLCGVELAGAFVPVLAMVIGLARSLGGSGVGMHAMVLTRGLAEGARLASAMGAEPFTLLGLAGVGDLVASHTRSDSAYFNTGVRLAAGTRDPASVKIAAALLELGREHDVEMPLTRALVDIVGGEDPLDVVGQLMSREAQPELR
jgi:glycerol-3-phosphate dehydrogenase (NAD(P)+)